MGQVDGHHEQRRTGGGAGSGIAHVDGLSTTSPLELWTPVPQVSVGTRPTPAVEGTSGEVFCKGRLFGDCNVAWHGNVEWLEEGSDEAHHSTSKTGSGADATASGPQRWDTVRPIQQRARPCSHGCGGTELSTDHPLAVRWECEYCAMSTVDPRDSVQLYSGCRFPSTEDTEWFSHVTLRRNGDRVDVCFDEVAVLRVSNRLALTLRHVCALVDDLCSETAVAVFVARWCNRWADAPTVVDNTTWLQCVVPNRRDCVTASEASVGFPAVPATTTSDREVCYRVLPLVGHVDNALTVLVLWCSVNLSRCAVVCRAGVTTMSCPLGALATSI